MGGSVPLSATLESPHLPQATLLRSVGVVEYIKNLIHSQVILTPLIRRTPFSPVSEEGTSEDNYAEVGLTFWVSFAGLVLALLTSSCILVKARHAGDGPFYRAGRLWVASGLAWVVWALAVRFPRLVCEIAGFSCPFRLRANFSSSCCMHLGCHL